MVAGEVAVTALMTSMLRASGQQTVTGVWGWIRRRFDRAGRRRVYQQLQTRVAAARLRIILALELGEIGTNALPVSHMSPELVGVLDHGVSDMAGVLEAWLTARDIAPTQLADAADELVIALAGLSMHPDPGWRRPLRRPAARALAAVATNRFDAALAEFVRLVDADTAKRRRARKAAQQRRPAR
jgi:hypothetical protein